MSRAEQRSKIENLKEDIKQLQVKLNEVSHVNDFKAKNRKNNANGLYNNSSNEVSSCDAEGGDHVCSKLCINIPEDSVVDALLMRCGQSEDINVMLADVVSLSDMWNTQLCALLHCYRNAFDSLDGKSKLSLDDLFAGNSSGIGNGGGEFRGGQTKKFQSVNNSLPRNAGPAQEAIHNPFCPTPYTSNNHTTGNNNNRGGPVRSVSLPFVKVSAASSGNRTERCSLASVLWLIKTVSENTALCKVEKGKRQAAEQRLLELGKHNNNSGNGFTSGDNDLLNGNNGCHVETLALAKVHVRTDSSSNLPSFGDDCDDMPAKPLQQLSNNFGASKRNLFGGNGNDENEVSFQQPEKNSAKLQQENKRLRDSVNSLTSKLAAMKAEKKRLHEEEERKKKDRDMDEAYVEDSRSNEIRQQKQMKVEIAAAQDMANKEKSKALVAMADFDRLQARFVQMENELNDMKHAASSPSQKMDMSTHETILQQAKQAEADKWEHQLQEVRANWKASEKGATERIAASQAVIASLQNQVQDARQEVMDLQEQFDALQQISAVEMQQDGSTMDEMVAALEHMQAELIETRARADNRDELIELEAQCFALSEELKQNQEVHNQSLEKQRRQFAAAKEENEKWQQERLADNQQLMKQLCEEQEKASLAQSKIEMMLEEQQLLKQAQGAEQKLQMSMARAEEKAGKAQQLVMDLTVECNSLKTLFEREKLNNETLRSELKDFEDDLIQLHEESTEVKARLEAKEQEVNELQAAYKKMQSDELSGNHRKQEMLELLKGQLAQKDADYLKLQNESEELSETDRVRSELVRQLQQEIAVKEQTLSMLKETLGTMQAQLDEQTALLSKQEGALAAMDADRKTMVAADVALKAGMAQKEAEWEEKERQANARVETYKTKIAAFMQNKADEGKTKQLQLEMERSEKQSALEEMRKQHKKLELQLSHIETEKQELLTSIVQLTETNKSLLADGTMSHKEMASANVKNGILVKSLEELEQNLLKSVNQGTILQTEKDLLSEQISDLQTLVDRLEKEKKADAQQLATHMAEAQERGAKLTALEQANSELKKEIVHLKEMNEQVLDQKKFAREQLLKQKQKVEELTLNRDDRHAKEIAHHIELMKNGLDNDSYLANVINEYEDKVEQLTMQNNELMSMNLLNEIQYKESVESLKRAHEKQHDEKHANELNREMEMKLQYDKMVAQGNAKMSEAFALVEHYNKQVKMYRMQLSEYNLLKDGEKVDGAEKSGREKKKEKKEKEEKKKEEVTLVAPPQLKKSAHSSSMPTVFANVVTTTEEKKDAAEGKAEKKEKKEKK